MKMTLSHRGGFTSLLRSSDFNTCSSSTCRWKVDRRKGLFKCNSLYVTYEFPVLSKSIETETANSMGEEH